MTWLKHQTRDAYWQHGSVCEDYSTIKAATLAVGGWGDAYKNTVANLVENLSTPVKGIVGPWVHKYPHFAVPEPRKGFLQEALHWWDRWLKDKDTGVEDDPAYTAYLMEGVRPKTFYEHRDGIWITEADWPNGISWHSAYFQTNGSLGATLEKLADSIKSPQTCGIQSGEYCAIWLGPELPGDQRRDDALSMCYTSEPFGEDYVIFGAPKVCLTLSSNKAQAQIAVLLNDIHPDGVSTRINYGVLNLSHYNSHSNPTPLPLVQNIEITLSLDQIAYRIPKVHKFRVAISTSYWPLLWPCPEAATLTLRQGSIDIPWRPSGKSDEGFFPLAESEAP